MEKLTTMSDDEVLQYLEDFNRKHSNPRSAIDIEFEDQKKLWLTLLELIADPTKNKCHGSLLNASKILTRNPQLMAQVVKRETLQLLLLRGGITSEPHTHSVREDTQNRDIKAIDESLRCLSNIYLRCAKSDAALSLEKDIISGIVYQVKRYKELKIPLSVISFDMRLLFLVTAYYPESKTLLYVDHRGITRLTDILSHCLDTAKERTNKANGDISQYQYDDISSNLLKNETEDRHVFLSEDEVTVMSNTMKVLFNCTVAANPEENKGDEELMSNLDDLCRILHLLLTLEKESDNLKWAITRDSINLLTNFPWGQCTESLMSPLNKQLVGNCELKEIEYDGVCMNAPKQILDFLIENIEKFQNGSPYVTNLREGIVPVLNVLCSIASGHRLIRKYFRTIVLPPLRDLNQRPEEGDSVRSRLCRLLTCPECQVSTMVAEFLFILCKEDVNRLVKHTGYGNAAGLIARRGLMAGGSGSNADQYSDDDDSDTEEYRENAHMINPVSGYVEPQRPSPFAGMSEERKEYEAVKLANIIDRLHSLGIVKPGKLGADGQPTAIDHVLELVENQASKIPGLQPEERPDSDDK